MRTMTYREIAAALHISEERVRQIEMAAICKVRKMMAHQRPGDFFTSRGAPAEYVLAEPSREVRDDH